MDRQLNKPTGVRLIFCRKALPWWIGGCLILILAILLLSATQSSLKVNRNSLTIAEAQQSEFNDYIRLNGTVIPAVSVQLSPQEGGSVEEILIEEGSKVKAGDPIIVLSSDNLDLQILNAEAELAEKENILRNTLIQMEQQRLNVRQDELQLSIDVQRNKRTFEQQKALYEEKLISKEDYLKAEEDYILSKNKYELIKERSVQDSLYRSVEIQQMRESLENMRHNMEMIRKRKEKLIVKAPIDGELGLLDVVRGQSIMPGTKIGQINGIGKYKIESQIDEHYIDRIIPGLEATFERQGDAFSAIIRKVYPEVREGKFKADLKFEGKIPSNIRNGQTYYLNLQLGEPVQAVIIPRGSFYQKSGGKWIYVLTDDGSKAIKRNIKIGRQNPQYYEVTEGLEPGDKIIVSSYESFGDNETLVF